MQTYDIYFRGKLMPDAEPQEARAAVAKMFKLEGKALAKMLSGQAIRIKTAVDEATASRYRKAFREAGTLVDILPHGEPAPPNAPPPEAGSREPGNDRPALTLLPPRTGSLADCAPKVEPPPSPDTAWMRLDDPGTVLDQTPAPATPDYDISAISMAPPGQGSLEDCAAPRAERPIPDISHLALEEKA
jgi:hypothetical protein